MSAAACLRVYYPPERAKQANALRWLATFPAYIRLLPIPWPDAAPDLVDQLIEAKAPEPVLAEARGQPRAVVALHPDGSVYRGSKAWLMAMWATREFRARALRTVRRGLAADVERVLAREMYIWGVAPREYARAGEDPKSE